MGGARRLLERTAEAGRLWEAKCALSKSRRPQFAGRKPCYIDLTSIFPIITRVAQGFRRSERLKDDDGPGWGVSRPAKKRGTACGGGVLLYEPRGTRGDVVSPSQSRRDAASESSSMNDERPTTNDIANDDGLRPACKRLAACAASFRFQIPWRLHDSYTTPESTAANTAFGSSPGLRNLTSSLSSVKAIHSMWCSSNIGWMTEPTVTSSLSPTRFTTGMCFSLAASTEPTAMGSAPSTLPLSKERFYELSFMITPPLTKFKHI